MFRFSSISYSLIATKYFKFSISWSSCIFSLWKSLLFWFCNSNANLWLISCISNSVAISESLLDLFVNTYLLLSSPIDLIPGLDSKYSFSWFTKEVYLYDPICSSYLVITSSLCCSWSCMLPISFMSYYLLSSKFSHSLVIINIYSSISYWDCFIADIFLTKNSTFSESVYVLIISNSVVLSQI